MSIDNRSFVQKKAAGIVGRAGRVRHAVLRRMGRASYGIHDLDLQLDAILKQRNGFFIEAGANDGLNQTNTLFFERHRGWNGLLVEPLPERAAQCRRNRSRCIVENAALVPFDFGQPTITLHACDLMSVTSGAFPSHEQKLQHIRDGEIAQAIVSQEIEVPATTLTDILIKHKIAKIDLLSLDVEGFELEVLKGIDFDKFVPSWMLIEARSR